MTSRSIHLVGTLPTESTKEAMAWAMWILGRTLGPTMPDGETGERRDWVNRLIENLKSHPDLELKGEEGSSGYQDRAAFRVKKGRQLRSVELDYFAEFEKSWPLYQEIVQPAGRRLQVGIPGHVDVAAVAFGFNLPTALRNLAPFRDATIRELAAIWDHGGTQVTFQLEVPVELKILTRIPVPGRWVAAKQIAREILKVVEAAPDGSRYGLHLCLADLNNKPMGRPVDAGPLVALANALMAAWPAGRVLEYLHVPLANGSEIPTMDPDYYAPLSELWLPDHVRFIGGFIHERSTIKNLIMIRDQIEYNLGRRIDIGASCGLGRRQRPVARRNLDMALAVATQNLADRE